MMKAKVLENVRLKDIENYINPDASIFEKERKQLLNMLQMLSI